MILTGIYAFCALQASMKDVVKEGNIFVTTAGNKDVVTIEHMNNMKPGSIVYGCDNRPHEGYPFFKVNGGPATQAAGTFLLL